jgi:peptide/nickel transport system permease protein
MGIFVLRRLGQTLLVLVICSVVIFVLMRMIPGDPVQVILGSEYSREAEAELRRQLGLDRSIVGQYLLWMSNVLRGEFGYSYIVCCCGRRFCQLCVSSLVPPLSGC